MDSATQERAFVRRRRQEIAGPVQPRNPFERRLAYPGGKKSCSHAHYLEAAVAWEQPNCCLKKLTDKRQPYGLS